MADSEETRLITLTTAAKEAGVTRQTLLRAARRGALQVVKHGTRNYTTLAWVRAWKNDPSAHLPGNPKLRHKS